MVVQQSSCGTARPLLHMVVGLSVSGALTCCLQRRSSWRVTHSQTLLTGRPAGMNKDSGYGHQRSSSSSPTSISGTGKLRSLNGHVRPFLHTVTFGVLLPVTWATKSAGT